MPGQPEDVGVAYDRAPPSDAPRQDLEKLARELGAPAPKVIVDRGRTVTAEARLPGLVNSTTGDVKLAAVVRAFGRFNRLRLSCFFFGSASPTASATAPVPPLQGYTVQ